VRVGNGAMHQTQLDIFGELMHCIYLYWLHEDFLKHHQSFRSSSWPRVKAIADYVADNWRTPGHGIWEMRGRRRQFTHEKGMCWVALDRAIKLARTHGIREDLQKWEVARDVIHQEVHERGFHEGVGAYVMEFDSSFLDAAVLRLPIMGVIDPKSERMRSTIAAIERTLMNNGLVYRYRSHEAEDGLPGTEGTFTACAFWLSENYVLQGRLDKAEQIFHHTIGFANDLGLMSEEIDPDTGEQLGNFPQGFTHIGLINAAVRIAAAKGQVSDLIRRLLSGESGQPQKAA
jgi:GH15 family glucan-1,4-alpha-glucosidase